MSARDPQFHKTAYLTACGRYFIAATGSANERHQAVEAMRHAGFLAEVAHPSWWIWHDYWLGAVETWDRAYAPNRVPLVMEEMGVSNAR